jgi:hypothetical protein
LLELAENQNTSNSIKLQHISGVNEQQEGERRDIIGQLEENIRMYKAENARLHGSLKEFEERS